MPKKSTYWHITWHSLLVSSLLQILIFFVSRMPQLWCFFFGVLSYHTFKIHHSFNFLFFSRSISQLDFPLFFFASFVIKTFFSIQHFRIMDMKTGKAIYIYSFFSYSISYCVFACTGNSFYWEKVCSIFCK